jgi:hypothetical protein
LSPRSARERVSRNSSCSRLTELTSTPLGPTSPIEYIAGTRLLSIELSSARCRE